MVEDFCFDSTIHQWQTWQFAGFELNVKDIQSFFLQMISIYFISMTEKENDLQLNQNSRLSVMCRIVIWNIVISIFP